MGGFGDAMNSKLRDNDNVRNRRSFEFYKDNPDKGQSHSGYTVNIPKLSPEEIAESKARLEKERRQGFVLDIVALIVTLTFLGLIVYLIIRIF